jgi:hypothetical protein
VVEPSNVGSLPVYDMVEGKSWKFVSDHWKFIDTYRVALLPLRIDGIEDISKYITNSTAYLPDADGYIIAFLYYVWNYKKEINYKYIALVFIEDEVDPSEIWWLPEYLRLGDTEKHLPRKVKRRPCIKYTKKQYYEIRAKSIFEGLYDFRMRGNRAFFRYDKDIGRELLYLLGDRVAVHLRDDCFLISYAIRNRKTYDSRSTR